MTDSSGNTARNTPAAQPWHTIAVKDAFGKLDSTPGGLSDDEIRIRSARYGPNLLTPPPSRSAWTRLLEQFRNVLIMVLLVAAAVTLAMGHWVDTAVILAVVIINAVIGFAQEGKAERALEAVRNMLSPQAMVVRGEQRLTIPAQQLVPGDVVVIQSGDRVPADLRLFDVHNLRIDESMLTGESVPVEKSIAPVPADAEQSDRFDLAYSGTLVTFGQGLGLVVETGDRSEIGRIGAMLSRVVVLSTPLTRQISRFARVLSLAILVIALFTALFGVLARNYGYGDMFLAAVGLAVAAIPEGLPAIITITLAIGVQRMASSNAIIRRLPAVETLGSVDVICSDKTGTLTRNEMMVQTLLTAEAEFEVTGSGYDPHGDIRTAGRTLPQDANAIVADLCRAAVLCNDAALTEAAGVRSVHGDPMEAALLVLGAKAGFQQSLLIEELPRTDVIPFESAHRFMATLHHDHEGSGRVYVKGATESILPRCTTQRAGAGEEPVDRQFWLRQTESIASRGQRTLAVATRAAAPDQQVLDFGDLEQGLAIIGLLGIIDPPRPEAIDAVARCRSAGIEVKMITGDHASTARAVAAQMGIDTSAGTVSGAELEAMDDEELRRSVAAHAVFARTSPEHKLRLVEALQAQRQVVAMTGDGVNDAPALKRADIGVAMGVKGSEAAKEAAEMVLADDNFATIVDAVEEGRTVYDNIRKSILFILPTNGGEALTIIAAIALGRMLPVTAVQILWVNMITAVTLALSLALEPAEPGIMQRRPRDADTPLLTPFMIWRIVFVAMLMVAATFGLFLWERAGGASIETARTVAVNMLVIAEVFYLLNTRYVTGPAFSREGLTGNRYVVWAIVAVLLCQLLFTYLPVMQLFFGSAAISPGAWLRILACGVAVFVAVELEKLVVRRFVVEASTARSSG